MNELNWLKNYYKFLLISGLGDDGEVVSKVRKRITELKIEKDVNCTKDDGGRG